MLILLPGTKLSKTLHCKYNVLQHEIAVMGRFFDGQKHERKWEQNYPTDKTNTKF